MTAQKVSQCIYDKDRSERTLKRYRQKDLFATPSGKNNLKGLKMKTEEETNYLTPEEKAQKKPLAESFRKGLKGIILGLSINIVLWLTLSAWLWQNGIAHHAENAIVWKSTICFASLGACLGQWVIVIPTVILLCLLKKELNEPLGVFFGAALCFMMELFVGLLPAVFDFATMFFVDHHGIRHFPI
ncbi:MAG: hypothetical protein K2X01_12040 [Cyanobacteria bacterium]|nr:hypothetical protein [Cyanobacteriota bacterium]